VLESRSRSASRLEALLRRERELWAGGVERIAGVDEAGVGPLAGPVVAAAVILPAGLGIEGVDDSKRLTPAQRTRLADEVRTHAVAWAVGVVEPREIDLWNVHRASLIAMRRAVDGLAVRPDHVLVDAHRIHGLGARQEPIVHGDATCHAIAAASILAKTVRDASMDDCDRRFPGYGFAEHKGYPTASHRDAIRRLGPCPVHRRSFLLLPHPRLWD
jgi:ribonuclease HII